MPTDLTPVPDRHLWIAGSDRNARNQEMTGIEMAPRLSSLDAHRRLRGPYTAAGSLMRQLVPLAQQHAADLVARHRIELLLVAPELRRAVVPASPEPFPPTPAGEERTTFYPGAYTRRVAHGLTEFVTELVRRGETPRVLVVENVEHADATDAEFLSVLLRRTNPKILRVVVASATDELSPGLQEALSTYAEMVAVSSSAPSPAGRTAEDVCTLASRYVATDCTSDEPRLLEAYESLTGEARRALHDARAQELERREDYSLGLGAIPFHREQGSDDQGSGVRALTTALVHCMEMSFYEAVIEIGRRILTLLDWSNQPEQCGLVTAKVATALTALERPQEAAALYDIACASTNLPSVHRQAAYVRAMIYARFSQPGRRDLLRARGSINTAIALAALLPDTQRAFGLTFAENGLALIEMHDKNIKESLRLVVEGLQRLDDELGPDARLLHRSVLHANVAQLLTRMGMLKAAIAEYDKAIASDPTHAEYYHSEYALGRAELHRRLGDRQAALADYERAIRLSPPYPEPYYNRADLALEMGDLDSALADLTYVLELEPSLLNAYINRASVLYELGRLDAARADIAAGLALDSDQAHLHALRGLIARDEGRPREAGEALDAALKHDPSMVAAWSNRAALHFDEAQLDEAITCLSNALELGEDLVVRSNRAVAYEHAGHWAEAVADYSAALMHEDADRAELYYLRGCCRLKTGEREAARVDFNASIDAGGEPRAANALRDLGQLAAS